MLESIQHSYDNIASYTHGIHGSWSLEGREATVVVFLLNWALHVVLANLDALADLVQNAFNGIQTLIELVQRRPEGQPHEMVARGVEQVPAMRRVDIEEDTWDDNCLLLEHFFEESKTVVEGLRERLEIEPDVEGRCRRDLNLETHRFQTREDVVTLVLEVPLKSNLLLLNVIEVKQRDGSDLKPVINT